jgi:rhodanese-related sulfurtransferase
MIFHTAMDSISREELKRSLERRELVIVDALPPEQFRKSHLPGALNIPSGNVAELAPRLLPDRNAWIVTYCVNFTGRVSEQVARELIAMGYKHVRNYEEGKQDWAKAGLPLEGEAPDEPIITFQPRSSESEAKQRAETA